MNIFMRGGSEGDTVLEIDVYDYVGADYFFGGVSAQSVRRLLKNTPNVTLIKVKICSEGGDALEGFSIYNLLKDHPARVEVEIDGLAASAASIIACAGDTIRCAANGFVMWHNAAGCYCGEGDELKSFGDFLINISDVAADIYAARTGLDKARCVEMMDATTWMTAAQAKELGVIDEIVPMKTANKGRQAAQQRSSLSQQSYAFMRLDGYENVPAGLRTVVEGARAAYLAQQPKAPQRQQQNLFPDPGGSAQDPHTGEETLMSEVTLNAFLSTIGIASAADLTARLGVLTKLETSLGKSGDAALGAIDALRNAAAEPKAMLARIEQETGKTGEAAIGAVLAWKESHEELPGVRAELAALQAERTEADLSAAMVKAKAEARHTKGREDKVRALLADKKINHEGAISMIEEWGVVPALEAGRDPAQSAAAPAVTPAGELKHEGKTYAEMKPLEKARLAKSNPQLFEQMRDAHEEAQAS